MTGLLEPCNLIDKPIEGKRDYRLADFKVPFTVNIGDQ